MYTCAVTTHTLTVLSVSWYMYTCAVTTHTHCVVCELVLEVVEKHRVTM